MDKDNGEEIFPVVDDTGKTIGKATRAQCHGGSMLLHPVVHLHVFDSLGRLYLQKRPDWKDIQPGKWDTAVGGHVDYGESVEQALLREAREAFDWVLIDAAAGIGTSFRLATQFADRCIVAATPDPASLRDAACAADALALEGHELLQLVVNRVQPRLFSRMNLTVDDMMDQTGLPLLGLVPEDPAVVLSAAAGKALILNSSGGAAEACLRISRRLRGEPMPLMRF